MNADFIGSFSFDQRLAPYDIRGSVAHVRMLAKQHIIPSGDAKKIVRGLESIARDLAHGRKLRAAEDIHFAIESELVRSIGLVGKKMHTARSRNDQVALDLKLYVMDKSRGIMTRIRKAQKAVLECAVKNRGAVMPGFTHLQHGQPVFFAHHILAYGWMLERDYTRFADGMRRADESPLGACALAGTAFNINPLGTAKALGISRVMENSIDAVSDRDFVAEFIFNCSLTMVHLSRLAEEMVVWSSEEFGYIKLADALTSGSSIMPQKRNPDALELLRGKSARTIGGLTQILSLLKGLPLAYNRDLQEDKLPLFDAADTTLASLEVAGVTFSTLQIDRRKMAESCSKGFLLATELADYLARKGMPFRAAHAVTRQIVNACRHDAAIDGNLQNVSLSILKKHSPLFGQDVFKFLSVENNARAKNSYGGTGERALSRQISQFRKIIR